MSDHYARLALITGASRGLGLALATALARRGWSLILDARTPGPLREAADAIRGAAPAADFVAIPGDVADPDHRAALAAAIGTRALDALINNAGTLGATPRPWLLEYPLEALDDAFRTNVTAQLGLIQAVLHALGAGAAIVNVTSDAAVTPYDRWGGYGATKAALEHLSGVLASEEPQWRVYRVDPGDMRTRMHQDAFPAEDIGDRSPPEQSVPGLVALLEGSRPSGRYLTGGAGLRACGGGGAGLSACDTSQEVAPC